MNDTEAHALDYRLRQVSQRDLAVMTRWDPVRELLLPLPWLLGSLLLADRSLYPLAMVLSFGFFLTQLRVVHGAFHYPLGLPRLATDCVMLVFSIAMLDSMHAVQWNHLRHHQHCLAEDDLEAMGARRSALGAVLLGPRFPISLHRAALTRAGRAERGWIVAELAANVAAIAVAFGIPLPGAVRYHLLAMAVGQCLTAYFAVWTVHHGCLLGHSGEELPVRTVRNPFRAAITFNMFFHLEHHLFPRVPTARLHIAVGGALEISVVGWPRTGRDHKAGGLVANSGVGHTMGGTSPPFRLR